MEMVKVIVAAFALAGCAGAADFSIEIGNPVAAAPAIELRKVKGALLAVRPQGCTDPAKAVFTGTAVRMSGSSRETAPLAFVAGSAPGSYAVTGGLFGAQWLAVISGDCAGAKAGALVPISAQGSYSREASRFFSHTPTSQEIDAALKTLSGGSK